MRRITAAAFALILAAAPAAVDAQARPARPAQPPRAAAIQDFAVPGVAHADHILAYREELGLTAQQVSRIRGLRNQLIEENRPLIEKLQAQRGALPLGMRMQQLQQQRQRLDEQAQQLRARMQQQRQQMNQLTEEQRQQLRQQMQQRQDTARARMQLRQDSMRALMQQLTEEQRQALRAAQQQRMRGAGVGGAAGQRGFGAGAGAAPGARGFGAALGMDEETRAALQEARENARQIVEQIDATLTAEQRAKLRELRPGRIGR